MKLKGWKPKEKIVLWIKMNWVCYLFYLYIHIYLGIYKKYCFKLGRSTWKLLHTIAATYPNNPSEEVQFNIQQFIRLLPKVYPCKICADDFAEMLVFLIIED